MNIYEIPIFILIFLLSVYLTLRNFKLSIIVLMVLSVLLHKELFSIYRWDLLPVRVFMLAFVFSSGVSVLRWMYEKRDFKLFWDELKLYLKDPFFVLLFLLWFFRGISIVFSKNLQASIFLFGFFTTVVALGFVLHKKLVGKPYLILRLIKIYILILFGVSLIGYLQLFVYAQFDFIFGALWNIPGRIARVGSTFWDVNHFAGLLGSLLPVIGVFMLLTNRWRNRILYFVMLSSMFAMLLLTGSRTSWIIVFVAFFSFLGVVFLRKFGRRGIWAILVAVILISIPLIREYSIKSSPFRAYVKQYFHYRIDSFDSHLLLIEGSIAVFEKYPYLGGGYGGFFEHFSKSEVAAEYFGRDPAGLNVRVPAHTIWGELLAETGFVGIYVFVLLAGLILMTLYYAALNLRSVGEYLVTAAMASSLLGWLMAGIFYSYNAEFFWLVIFLYFFYGISVLGKEYNIQKIVRYFFRLKGIGVYAVLFSGLLLVFWGLGSNHLVPWDEAIYAQVAKNMTELGDYLVPRWYPDQFWFEKPPLYMWMASLFINLLGVSSWAVRLPSAILGFATFLLVYKFASRQFNKTVGMVSAFVLITTVHFLYYSRASMLDVSTTFFMTVSLFLYFWGHDKKKILYWLFSGVFSGFAFMTKGVVGGLPLIIIGFFELYLLFSKERKINKESFRNYMSLGLAFLGVILPWHLEMIRRFGPDFFNVYIGYHVLTRATSSIEDKGRPFFWYITVLRVSMRLWFIALLAALPISALSAYVKKNKTLIFLLIWTLVTFLFFSVSKSKLIWYIIPIYPALSILIGYFVERFIQFVMDNFSRFNNIIFKSLFLYTFFTVGLFYLFLNKEMVYTSDLTASQAKLLQEKDEIFETEDTIYADRIEIPLVLYYSDSPFEIVDFGPLREKLTGANYDERVIYITKESRHRALSEIFPTLELQEQENEWVLGFLPSQKKIDQDQLDEVNSDLTNLQFRISNSELVGEPISVEDLTKLNELLIQKQELENKIQNEIRVINEIE